MTLSSAFANLVKMGVSGTPGTGTITLGSAIPPFFGTSELADGGTYAYSIVDGNFNIASGHGIYSASGTTLTRDPAERCNVGGVAQSTPMSLSSAAIIAFSGVTAIDLNTILPNITPPAGTTSMPPVIFATGTNTTTAQAGAMEYDGAVPYFSVAASERGVMLTEQFVLLSSPYTLTSQTGAQKLFNATTNGALTLAVGTYEFICQYSMSSMSGTSGSFGFALGGTATFTQAWTSNAIKETTQSTAGAGSITFNTAANTAIASNSTGTGGFATIAGFIRVTVAGTVIPEVSLGNAAAAVVAANSFFSIWPKGASAVTTVGNWS